MALEQIDQHFISSLTLKQNITSSLLALKENLDIEVL